MDLKWLKSLYPPDESLSSARANQLVKAMKGCISVSKSKTGEIIYRENRFEGQKLKKYSRRLDRRKVSVAAELGAQGRLLMHRRKKIASIRQRNDVKVPPELSAHFRDPPDVLTVDESYDDDIRRLNQSDSEEAPRRRRSLQPDPDSLVIMTVERENVKKHKKDTPRIKRQSVVSVPDKRNFLHAIEEQEEEEEGLTMESDGRLSPVPTYRFAPVVLPRIGQSHLTVTPRARTPEAEEDSEEEDARDRRGAGGVRLLRNSFDFTELRDMIQDQVVQDQVHQLNLLERNCVDERKVLGLKARMSEQQQFRGLVSLRSPEKRRLTKLNKRRSHKSLSFSYGTRLEGARPALLRRNTLIT